MTNLFLIKTHNDDYVDCLNTFTKESVVAMDTVHGACHSSANT